MWTSNKLGLRCVYETGPRILRRSNDDCPVKRKVYIFWFNKNCSIRLYMTAYIFNFVVLAIDISNYLTHFNEQNSWAFHHADKKFPVANHRTREHIINLIWNDLPIKYNAVDRFIHLYILVCRCLRCFIYVIGLLKLHNHRANYIQFKEHKTDVGMSLSEQVWSINFVPSSQETSILLKPKRKTKCFLFILNVKKYSTFSCWL